MSIFFVSLLICCYFFQLRISNYLAATAIISTKLVRKNRIKIPEVTICSLNAYDDSEYYFIVDVVKREIEKVLEEQKRSDLRFFEEGLFDYIKGRKMFYQHLLDLNNPRDQFQMFIIKWDFSRNFDYLTDTDSKLLQRVQEIASDIDLEKLSTEMVFDMIQTDDTDIWWASLGKKFRAFFHGKIIYLEDMSDSRMFFNELELLNRFTNEMFGVNYEQNWWTKATSYKRRSEWNQATKFEMSLLTLSGSTPLSGKIDPKWVNFEKLD